MTRFTTASFRGPTGNGPAFGCLAHAAIRRSSVASNVRHATTTRRFARRSPSAATRSQVSRA
ncbi:MAG: hypothetical protein JWO31_130 [Phycisphaerales bacterium]|nr:hypothetical protein [Phycisphaerales bacterium]